MSRLCGLLMASAALLVVGSASANAGGLAGYTGKPYATLPQGQSCGQCHTGGTPPTVTVNGPTSLTAGQVGNYTLVVTTGQRGSGSVAATDGVVLTAGSGFRESFGEMVQTASQASGGTFAFSVKAPAYGGTVRLWAVGLASNGSGTGGDGAAQTTRDITIVGPPAPPGGGSSGAVPGSPDGGGSAPPGDSSGDGGSAGTGPTSGAGGNHGSDGGAANPGDPGADPGDESERSFHGPEVGACATAASGPSSSSSSSGTVFAASIVAAAIARARRRVTPSSARVVVHE